MDDAITASMVLSQVAQAIPENLRADMIIVGSLAASYQLLKDANQVVRTKDVDAMVAPYTRHAVGSRTICDRTATLDTGAGMMDVRFTNGLGP